MLIPILSSKPSQTNPSTTYFASRTVLAVKASCRGSRSFVVRASSTNTQQNPFEKAVNSLQVALTRSPLNEGKKRFFKLLAGEYDEAATRAKIDTFVKENPVMVFSWSVCPFAQRSQRILRETGAKFSAIELDKVPDGKAQKAELGMLTAFRLPGAQTAKALYNVGRTSVPSIWIGGECIGGCNDGQPGLIPLLESGQLEARLKRSGAL